ncbi:MAG TPA: NADH-quinone oxidoreductase subunit NuoG [Chloroflexota bacterium]
MENQVTITVDGNELRVAKDTLLWEACKANGIDIPIFCYHTKLGPVGACRTCLVEVEGMTKGPITACSTPVADGMKVRTRSPVVEKAQRGIFEFLLANHPLDCPICDRGGECPLQDQTFAYGPGASRYIEPKRHHEKPVVLGPTIALDRERCVLCWRCVRFCSEVAEDNSIVLLDRADHSMVGTFKDEPYVSAFSGNVVELCPVGALTSRKQRFTFRPWELRNRPSVCPHCAMGCNINISVRKSDEVIRFLSRDNPEIDDSWLCDRGRFGFEFINSPHRLTSPLIRRGDAFVETSWDEAFSFIAERLTAITDRYGPDVVAGVASPRLGNEDLFVFKQFMQEVVGTEQLDHFPRPDLRLTSEQSEAIAPLTRTLMPIAGLDDAKTIVLLGADPSQREPVLELRIRLAMNRHGAKLLAFNPHEVPLSSKATASFTYPAERFAEVARSLAGDGSWKAGRGSGDLVIVGVSREELVRVTGEYFAEGPVAVIYDDTFPGVEDRAEALVAVSEFIQSLGTRVTVGTLPLLDDCNSMGARDLGILPGDGEPGAWPEPVVARLALGDHRVRAAFLLGADLAGEMPETDISDRLDNLDLLVVHELMMTATARRADVVLPAASFAEKLCTFTNSEGRIQKTSTAVPSPGIALADWQILVDLSQYLERHLDYSLPQDVWNAVRSQVQQYSNVDYGALGEHGHRVSQLQPV